ncbi:MAG TPA: hypothetical protein VKX30_06045 [Flavobacteriaceae bacterium]|nr:hypothetical protein [Flavobacteriaceae bacterium]
MRYAWFLLFLLTFTLVSCSDGDIILTNFDFENSPLETCESQNSRVFFKRNKNSPESLALTIPKTDSLYYRTDTIQYPLNGNTAKLFYRLHDEQVPNNYFCQSIPPSYPKTEQEYVSDTGMAIVYVLVKNSNKEEGNPVDTYPYTLTTQVSVILKDISLYNGDETIIKETLSLGTISNILSRTIVGPDQE